jgi:predicted DNA-binding WGR domain protein
MDQYAYFQKVESGANNNKFYELRVQSGQIVARFGRVGTEGQTKVYPLHKWNEICNARHAHGYDDVTHLRAKAEAVAFRSLGGSIADLVAFLRKVAGESISRNYASGDTVTQAMVDRAQAVLDEIGRLNGRASARSVNLKLQELWTIVPRKMRRVSDYLLPENATMATISQKIKDEQDLLDQMRAQVATAAAQPTASDQTILDAMGLEMREATAAEKQQVMALVEPKNQRRVQRVFRVTNKRTQEAFDKVPSGAGDPRLFFHGSYTANWWSIVSQGLVIRPTSTHGSALGRGLYFASLFQKSAGYTDVEGSCWAHGSSKVGYMGVFAVKMGRTKTLQHNCDYNADEGARRGEYDSIHLKGGGVFINDEYTVYRNDRATIAYLLEIAP